MAIQSRLTTSTPLPGAASALPVTLADGDVIEARVAAVLPNGQVRLATSLGTTDVSTSVALTPGATVKLLVQNVGAQLTLGLIEATQTSAGSAANTAAARAYGSALAGPQQALAEALQSALPNQAGPAALFANLKPLVEIAGRSFPADVTSAARAVLAHALDGSGTVTADAVKQAVVGSGVFRESRLAAGDAAAAQPAGDLKSALLALRSTLAAVSATLPSPSAGAPAEAGAEPDSGSLASSGSSGLAVDGEASHSLPGTPGPVVLPGPAAGSAGTVAGEAASAAPDRGPVLPAAIEEALARLPAAARDAALQAIRASSDPGAPELARVLARAGLAVPSPEAAPDTEAAAPPNPPARPAGEEPVRRVQPASIPRIDLPPRPEPPTGPSLRNGMSQGDAVRILLDQTDATLDRVRLSQYGALHRDDPAQPTLASRDAPAWIFDVPVLQGREATSAQVRITRDGGGQAGEAAGRRWSVEFALDTATTGPIHAEIRLWGRHVGVTLWAERTATARLLKDQASVLHDALGQAELDVEDLAVLAGSPQPPQAEHGYFVDTRS